MRFHAPFCFAFLFGLSSFACSSGSDDSGESQSNAATAAPQAQGKAFQFTCTAHPAQGETNSFQSVELKLQGTSATLSAIAFTDTFTKNVADEIKSEQDFLAKGVDFDGKPLSAEDRAKTEKHISQMQAIAKAGENKSLALAGKLKPHVRVVKHPSTQYPLDPTTGGIDADTLFDLLGNEGDGARLLLPPEMVANEKEITGAGGQATIEFEGTQGPVFDHYDCK